MSFLLGSESEEEHEYRLCHTRFLVHVVRFSRAESMWRADCLADEEVVEHCEIRSEHAVPACCRQSCVPPLLRPLRIAAAAAWNPKIASSRLGLFSFCAEGSWVKVHHRLSQHLTSQHSSPCDGAFPYLRKLRRESDRVRKITCSVMRCICKRTVSKRICD